MSAKMCPLQCPEYLDGMACRGLRWACHAQGIVFSVRPPKKSWKNIANLSGGEKTLSSLSLVFALHHYKPTPLYVMDEIDAALGALCMHANTGLLHALPCALQRKCGLSWAAQ